MARHIIKKYANRRLYDTQDKRPVTIKSVGELLDKGEEIVVIDQKTGKDITSITLAQIKLAKEKEAAYLKISSSVIVKQNGKQPNSRMVDASIEHSKKALEEMGKKIREILDKTPPALPPSEDWEPFIEEDTSNHITTHIRMDGYNTETMIEIENLKNRMDNIESKIDTIINMLKKLK